MLGMKKIEEAKKNLELTPEDLSPGSLGHTAIFFLGLGLGAAAMYLLDPVHGRTRRAHLEQKGMRAKNQGLKYGGKYSRHFRNRAIGFAHKMNPLKYWSKQSESYSEAEGGMSTEKNGYMQ